MLGQGPAVWGTQRLTNLNVGDAGVVAWMVGTGGASLGKQSIPGWTEHQWLDRESPGGQRISGWAENLRVDIESPGGQRISRWTEHHHCAPTEVLQKRKLWLCSLFSKCNYVKVTEEEMKLGVVIRKEK